MTLGAPRGNKAAKQYRIPEWIVNSENWQKRLFLASYFGAELSKPHSPNGYNFHGPAFSVSKIETLEDNAMAFLLDIRKMLNDIGVQTSDPAVVEGYRYKGKKGESVGFRLMILSNTENLKKFFEEVSYLYNRDKRRLSMLSASYLNYVEASETRGTP